MNYEVVIWIFLGFFGLVWCTWKANLKDDEFDKKNKSNNE